MNTTTERFTYVNEQGQQEELTTEKMLNIRISVAREFETENYKTLPESYRAKNSLQRWLDYQVPGRLYLTGTRHHRVWTEFFRKFYDTCYSISLSVCKSSDDADNCVTGQFDAFRYRAKYNTEAVGKLWEEQKACEQRLRGLSQKLGNPSHSKSYEALTEEFRQTEERISQIRLEIEDELRRQATFEDERRAYNGLTIEEIRRRELETLTSHDAVNGGWFNSKQPVAGYIMMAQQHIAMQKYNKVNNGTEVVMSKIVHTVGKKTVTDEVMFDYRNEDEQVQDEIALEDDEQQQTYQHNIDEYNNQVEDGETEEDDDRMVIVKSLIALSEYQDMIYDYVLCSLPYSAIAEKYGLPQSTAKSIIRSFMEKMTQQVRAHVETQKIEQGVIDTGVIRYYFPNRVGCLRYECGLRDGLRDGMQTFFYENGHKREETEWKDGKKNGHFASYYENGKLERTGTYENGEKTGTWCRYYENGKLEEEKTLLDDDCCSYTIYSENGTVEERGFINGFGQHEVTYSISIDF